MAGHLIEYALQAFDRMTNPALNYRTDLFNSFALRAPAFCPASIFPDFGCCRRFGSTHEGWVFGDG
jgi:hypothetical protein